LAADILIRINSIESRLSELEFRIGTGPDVGGLDTKIAQARRDKEAAIGEQDVETIAPITGQPLKRLKVSPGPARRSSCTGRGRSGWVIDACSLMLSARVRVVSCTRAWWTTTVFC
jgi:hypothetical protein